MMLMWLLLGTASSSAETALPPPRLETAPELVTGADPVYPDAARAAGRSGDVVLRIVIGDDGSVERVDIQSVPVGAAFVVDEAARALGDAAAVAATHFVFTPALFCVSARAVDGGILEVCGQKRSVAVDYRMTFTLAGAAARDVVNFGGVVNDAVNHNGIGGVEVTVFVGPNVAVAAAEHAGTAKHGAAAAVGIFEAVTTDDGHFEIKGVPDGDHKVRFVASGFERAEIVEHFAAGERTDVIVELSERVVRETVVHRHRPLRAVSHVELTPLQATTTLTAEALQEVRGRSLAATLTEIPGVTVVQSGPQMGKPVVRGQFGRRLLTLVDGVRHEGQDWGIDHAPEIDPFSAGAISVIRGAAGVRYGPDAVAGVVLVEPRPLRNNPGVDSTLDLIGVDNGLMGTAAARIDAVPDGLPGLSLRIEGDASKGAAVATPTYVLGNTASQTFSFGTTASYTTRWLGGAATAKASFRHLQQDNGVCFCLKVNTPDDLEALVLSDRPLGAGAWTMSYELDPPRQAVAHDTAIARAAVDVDGVGSATATYAFQLDLRDEFDAVRQSITGPQYRFNLRTHAFDLVVDHEKLTLARFTLSGTAGVHLDVQEHAYSGLPLIPNFRRFTGGAFAVEALDVKDSGAGDVTVEVGARYDQMAQTAFLTRGAFAAQVRRDKINRDACTQDEDSARCDSEAGALTFSAGARTALDLADLDDALTLSAETSSATRFPDVDELYLSGRAPSFPVFGLGDGALGPETTLSASMGARLALPAFVIDISFFASKTHNYIAFGPERGPNGSPVIDVLISGAYPRFSYDAVDALFSGFDGSVVVAPAGIFSLVGQFSSVAGRNLSTGGALPFVPPPQGHVEVQGHLPDIAGCSRSVISTGLLVVMEQTRTDQGSDFTPPPPGYSLIDAALRTSVLKGRVHLGLEGKNLLNQRYRDSMSLLRFFADQPGREIWFRMSVDIDSDDAG